MAMAGDIAGSFTASGRVADVDGPPKVEMFNNGGDVLSVVVHIVAVADLTRPAMATPVMSDDAIAPFDEVEHLRIPVVTA